uniref:DNA-directed RNA polymerase I subunit rpa49 n=1 Tax=Auxenochlorella protothecoides TaxID=3075 RepID=A0A1D2A768_AUXPR
MGKRKSGASSTFPETIAQQPAQLRSAAGPYAVYFPSGYDPATGVKWETYTHAKKRHSLIVGRADSVDFVGGSMGGEHSTAPPCRYALGVFDRASGALTLAPLAHDRLLRLEPRVCGVDYGPSEALNSSVEGLEERKAATLRLVGQLGSQRRQRQLLAREAARVDPRATVSSPEALRGQVARGAASPSKEDLVAAAIAGRALPPHDPGATTAPRAYPTRGLVWDALWDALPVEAYLRLAREGPAPAEDADADGAGAEGAPRTAYVAARLADRAAWAACAGPQRAERARLLGLLDAGATLLTRHAVLRPTRAGLSSLEARTGVPADVLAPLLARFYTHHAAGAEAGAAERWVQAPGQRDLMLSWMVAAALRAEPSASLDGAEAEALAATLQLRLAALAERCRELGATTSTTGAHGAKKTRVTLLPPSAEARTLASYFPGLKMEKKRAGRG